jgi:hypothetical protein
MSRIPDDQLAKLAALATQGHERGGQQELGEPDRQLRRADVWLLPANMTAFVIVAKDRPHLVVGLQGPEEAPTRALLIEGTSQPQSEPPSVTVTLLPGDAGLRNETHFVFVSRRYLRRKPGLIVQHADYLGHVPALRLEDVRRAVRACSLVAVKKCWGLS